MLGGGDGLFGGYEFFVLVVGLFVVEVGILVSMMVLSVVVISFLLLFLIV